MSSFRPFTAADYPALAELRNLVWGEARNANGLSQEDAEFEGDLLVRLVVEQDDRPVLIGGYSDTPWSPEPDKYFLTCLVHPAYQGRGLGSAWFAHVFAEVQDRGARLLTATTRDDHAFAVPFLERRGFQRTIREPESRLDVTTFDPTPFRAVADRAAAEGINIISLAELRERSPDWVRQCWELEGALIQDIPTSEPFAREPVEAFVERLNDPAFCIDGYFLAVDTASGRVVGVSTVDVSDGDPSVWGCGLTGVLRSHRRRGIALALKLQAIAYAAAHGASILVTDNEENNPMYILNQRLGFRYTWSWLGFERQLKS